MAVATQSVSFGTILDALQSLLERATGLPERAVIEWHAKDRPSVDIAGIVVWFRWVGGGVDAESGAGRHGMRNRVTVEVAVTNRNFKDGGMRDKRLGRAHLAAWWNVVDAAAGRFLHTAYDAKVGDAPPMPSDGATVVSATGTMKVVELPAYDRPRPEQGYAETRIGIEIPCVLRVTLNDVPELEE